MIVIKKPPDFDDQSLATVHMTFQVKAIVEAGQMILDNDGQPMDILYETKDSMEPTDIQPHVFQ